MFWKQAARTAGLLLGVWLGLWCFGTVLLPFAVGLAIALAAEPLTGLLEKRLRLPRWAAAGCSVAALYAGAVLGVVLLCRVLCRELVGFVRVLPEAVRSLTIPAQAAENWLLSLAARFPDGLGDALQEGVASFFENGAGLATKLYDWVFSFATDLLKGLPDIFLFLLTAVLSSFMLASQLPGLKGKWAKKAPPQWQSRWNKLQSRLKSTLGGWLKAQAKLMLLSALILTAGFLVLGVDYPLLFGLGIALIDALPVLGTGMVLIPWGLWSFLQGNSVLAVGLVCLYAAAALTRTALEPRMLGKQIGLDPLLTLLALYAGYHFAGILGMILFPIAAILIKQFWGDGAN